MTIPLDHLFARPEFLGLFLLLALLAVRIAVGSRRRRRDWKALGQGGNPRRSGEWAWLAAMAFLIVAIARPRWGGGLDPNLPPGHDVVLVVDVSRSMAAEDALPDRLGVARDSAESLVRALGREPGERVAIVAFAGRAVLRCPLTENLGAVVEILQSLHPGSVKPGGSDLTAALDAALSALDDDRPEPVEGRMIVILSDGEFHNDAWRAFLPKLKGLRVLVHTIAIGDPDRGHEVPVPEPSGATRPLTFEGQVVLSKRVDKALRSISQATGGAFLPLGLKPANLGRLYEERIAPVARRHRDRERLDERIDRFPIFLAASLLLGVVAMWPRFWRRPLILGLLAIALVAAVPGSVSEAIQRGRSAYDRGDFAAALAEFDRAIALRPDHPLPRYDAAAALFQLQRFIEAEAHYRQARQEAGPALRRKIDYALGNTAFARGDYRAAVSHYDRCLTAPQTDRLHADALLNRAEAVRRIPPEPSEPEESSGSGPKSPGEGGSEPPEGPPPDGSEPPPMATSPSPEGSTTPPEGSDNPRAGGGGTNGNEPPDAEPPADQLARAIENIRQAKDRRAPRVDAFTPAEHHKNW